MVALKSVFVAALAATSVSAYSGRYRRHNGHSHNGVVPSIPRNGFRNDTIPAVPTTTAAPIVSAPVPTGVSSVPVPTGISSVPVPIGTGVADNTDDEVVTVTQTSTKEVFTTVTVSYTLGNGKVVTTSFTKVCSHAHPPSSKEILIKD